MNTLASTENTDNRKAWIGLAAILALAVINPVVFFLGPRVVDHFLCAQYAHDLLSGRFEINPSPQSQRFGLLLPLALFQALFGINGLSSALPAILASLGHVFAAYVLALSLFSYRTALWSAAIVACVPLETLQASILYPDLISTGIASVGLALVVRESLLGKPRRSILWVCGALLGWAYLVKQTAIFPFLFCAGWVLAKRRWELFQAGIPFILTLLAEAAAFYIMKGDPFYRNTSGTSALADHLEKFFYPTPFKLTARMVWEWPSLIINPLDRGFPAFGGLTWASIISAWALRKSGGVRWLIALSGTLLLTLWLWPARLRPFIPALICDPRHACVLLLPMALMTGEGLVRLRPRLRWLVSSALFGAFLTCTTVSYLYLSYQDAGEREAFATLKHLDAKRVRATDIYGNASLLFSYLDGFSKTMEIRIYSQQDLPGIHDEWVVINDRAEYRLGKSQGRIRGSELPIPPAWQEIWAREFKARWDPRDFLRGQAASRYRIRIFFAP